MFFKKAFYYKNKLGNPTKQEFKDLAGTTVNFAVGGGMIRPNTKSNYTLQ